LHLWLPSAAVAVYHGTQKERETLRRKMTSSDVDVILTTYSYFQTESAKQDRAFLRRYEYGCMILDEGHSIKNSDTARNRFVLFSGCASFHISKLLSSQALERPTRLTVGEMIAGG
jgi:SNF2 family DNA or RNA helicase